MNFPGVTKYILALVILVLITLAQTRFQSFYAERRCMQGAITEGHDYLLTKEMFDWCIETF